MKSSGFGDGVGCHCLASRVLRLYGLGFMVKGLGINDWSLRSKTML